MEKLKVARYDDVHCRAQRRCLYATTGIRWLPITDTQAITRSQSRESSQLVHEVHYARIAHVYRSSLSRWPAFSWEVPSVSRNGPRGYHQSCPSEPPNESGRVFGMRDLFADLEVGEKVVDCLGENTRPVDQIDCAEMVFLVVEPGRSEREIVEQGL